MSTTQTHALEIAGLEISPAKRALLEARLAGRGPASAIPRLPDGARAPLSFAQERFWFLDRLGQGGAAYVIPRALRLHGPLDAAALERAVGEVVRRHGALRTTIREVDGGPVQAVAPFAGFALPVDDLAPFPAGGREAEARRRAAAEAATPFDLVAGPLFRARLLRLGAESHVLLVSMHHVVSDGWSVGVLFRELWALYHAAAGGRPDPLPEPPLQYADWAAWEREQARGAAHARALAYWRGRLAGAPEVLELPADRPRPPVPSLHGDAVPVSVSAEVADRLRALARAEGATLFMVVLAAFQALLSRHAGTPDVVVGTPVAGRTRREVEGVIGLFMNLLVLRTDLSGDPTFRQALARARETVLGAWEHQELPFERLVDELRPGRSLSHATVFQVVFQLDEDDGGGPEPAALRVEGMDTGAGAAKLDLTLELDAHARGITGALTYATDLFERGTARRMAEHLERLLEQVAADPDRRLSRLELMGRAERERVLGWNRTTAAFPADRCIHQLFEEQAARTPDALALVGVDGERLSYRELDARANRLARRLVRLGVGPETRVGLLLERGPALLAALLGVMKAGGAYVPLDRAYPDERLAYMLADSGARVLLTQASLRRRLSPPPGVAVVSVDGDAGAIAAEPPHAAPCPATAENLAYVIYTSGSTGRPKGVAMHHRGVCNYIHWGIRAYGADAGEGAPVFTSMAVDLTLTNLLPLFAGRAVRLLAEDSPVEALAAALREGPGFGLVKITPVHLSLVTPLLQPEQARSAARTLVIGADFLTAEPTVFWQDHAPGVRLMNEYGPTETVVGCSAYVLPPGRHRAGPVPVGHPIQNLRFYVLDAHLQPVPLGLPGELYIGGAGVARGYLGRPGLTAETFLPEPFAGAGERMYRTGDRARWQADGNLLILGRTDHQVKIRGYRVEPGEVEAVIRRDPRVRACLVVARDEAPGDRRLVAYVVGGAGAAELREHVGRSLPDYMVPAAFVALDSLPETATGKLDPKSLPAPDYGAPADDFDEPESYLEVQLVQLWEELLGVDGVGVTQNFFELGGNSFLALRLFSKVNRALGCDLPVSTLFAGATVRQMAEAIHQQRRASTASGAPVVALQPLGSLPPLFVVHSSDRNVMGYVHLVRHLGAGQPVHGVRDVGDDMARPVGRIAAEHVAAIRQVQPRGPYYLAGWSFGGFVVYEMARQLEAAGERPAFVGLLDTVSPAYAKEWPLPDDDLEIAIGLAGEASARMRRRVTVSRAGLEGLPWEEQTRRIVAEMEARAAAPPGFDAAELRADCRSIRDRWTSLSGYQPGPCGAVLTLFEAEERDPAIERFFDRCTPEERRTRGWCDLAPGRVEVHHVPGVHATIATEPNVRVLAERMRAALEAARARASSDPAGAR